MNELADAFRREVRRRLVDDYLPKVRRVLERCAAEDLWWRPNERSNAIGNLVLHLAGNLRQWVVSGVGGAPDVRVRSAEFAHRTPLSAAELWAHLDGIVREALAAIDAFPDDRWLEPRTIQGYAETAFSAVFHAVEHFSGHVGQMLYVAKLRHPDLPSSYAGDGSGGP